MRFSRLQHLLIVVSILLVSGVYLAFTLSSSMLHEKMLDGVSFALESSLHDEIVSSDLFEKPHDRDAIVSVLSGINKQLRTSHLINSYNTNLFPVNLVAARVSNFDGIDSINENVSISGLLKSSWISIDNNGQEYSALVETYTSIKLGWVLAWLFAILLVSFILHVLIPQPLVGFQRSFYNFIYDRYQNEYGLTTDEIISFCSRNVQPDIILSPDAWWIIEVLLSREDVAEDIGIESLSDALSCAVGNNQIELDDVQRAWFKLGMTKGFVCSESIGLALSEDSIEVDIQTKSLLIKEVLTVSLTKSPLAYYCLYLDRRKQGLDDGWMPNTSPRAEREAFNGEVIKWLEVVNAPLNATQDVDYTQLNNMRNRIIQQIADSFGGDNEARRLADASYGFESRPSNVGGAIRDFRVVVTPEHISIIKPTI